MTTRTTDKARIGAPARRLVRGLGRGKKAAHIRIDGRITSGPFYTVKAVKVALGRHGPGASVSCFTFEDCGGLPATA